MIEAPPRERNFEVVLHDGVTWVMSRRTQQPIGFFEGEQTALAEQAAGILGLADAQTRQRRYGRAQEQKARLATLPGWEWWRL